MNAKQRDAANQWSRCVATLANLDAAINRTLAKITHALDFADALEARRHAPELLKLNTRRSRITRFMGEALAVALTEHRDAVA